MFCPLRVVSKCLILYIILSNSVVNAEVILEVFTEDTPLTSIKNKAKGSITAFVEQVLQKAHLPYKKVRSQPWPRIYEYAKKNKNVLIYPLTRTSEREPDFHWIGELTKVDYYLYKLRTRDDIVINNIEDAKELEIGLIPSYIFENRLIELNFTKLQYVNHDVQNIRKLLAGRIDVFPKSSLGLKTLCENIKYDCSNITPAFKFTNFDYGVYIALSLDTDKTIIEHLRNAYKQARIQN